MLRVCTRIVALMCMLLLVGCTTINNTNSIGLFSTAPIGLVPFANNSQTPGAGQSAAAIVADILRSNGADSILFYQRPASRKVILPGLRPALTTRQALRWARRHNMSYLITGVLTEWRYKVGIDGEPTVGFTLQMFNVRTGQVVWSAVGSRIGTSRQSISGIAQRLMNQILSGVNFK